MKSKVGLFVIVLMLSCITVLSQSKAGFNYQGVVRDASKNLITDQVVGLRFSILNSSLISVYSETQSLTSNEIGLVNTTIGDSNPALFNDIDWGDDTYSLKVELDIGDDSSWEIEEIKELKYVPYAHHALSTGAFEGEIIVDNKGDLPNAENISFRSNGTQMSRIMSYTSDENNSMLTFSNINAGAFQEMMRLGSTGNLGIGTTTPKAKLDVNGAITIKGYLPDDGWASDILSLGPVGGHFGSQGSWKSFWTWNGYRQTGTNDWVVGGAYDYTSSTLIALGDNGIEMSTADYGATGTYSAWPTLRMKITKEGRVGIGTNNPVGKLQIQGPAGWADEVPLFQVKNSDGVPVFAVYNNGVRILVEDDPDSKGRPRGGFSVAGFDRANKSYTPTYDFMRISPDSIRFNINNTDGAKGPRGGFAVGGFDRANKGPIDEDFMYITPNASGAGVYNTFLGYHSGTSNSTGSKNAFYGYSAGVNNSTGSNNVFVGQLSGSTNSTGGANVYVGDQAGRYNTGGNSNVFIGYQAGYNTGSAGAYHNVYIGYKSGVKASTGYANVAVGDNAGYSITGGDRNVLIGAFAGYNAANIGKNSTGSGNVLIGEEVATAWTSGVQNVMLGKQAGQAITTGNNNTLLGYQAGRNMSSDVSNSVCIGYSAGSANTASDRLFIDGSGFGTTYSTSLIYGYFGTGTKVVRVNGNLQYTGSLADVSDLRLKTNLSIIDNALDKINQINGYYYNWSTEAKENLIVDDKRQLGVVAQEVEKVFPELITKNEEGYLTVNYVDLTPILLEGIKEQHLVIKQQNTELQTLRNELEELKQMVSALMSKEE